MYSMPYYTYGSTANFLFLGPTAHIYYISKEQRCNEDLRSVGNFFKLNKSLDSCNDFSDGQLNTNGLQ